MHDHGRTILVVAFLAISSLAALPAQSGQPPPPPPPPPLQDRAAPTHAQVAVELLDRLQAQFDVLGAMRDEREVGHELSMLANDARACLNDGALTPAFHSRFARLLLVVRLAIITDTGHILAPIVDREFTAFVHDVTGKVYDPNGSASEQIGVFSDAVATELTRLRALARRMP